MKRNLTKLALSALVLLLAVVSFSCSVFGTQDNLINGTWDSGFGQTITITNTTYASDDSSIYDWDVAGDIVDYSKWNFNRAGENPESGNYGFLLIKVTANSGNAAAVGTYTILRWKELTTIDGVTTVQTCEAYPAGWATAEEAVTEANTADNFTFFSTITKVQ